MPTWMSKCARFLRANGSSVFVFAVLAASLALNVVLGLKLQRASTRLTVGIREQMRMPDIPVRDSNGNTSTLSFFGERPTVLYVMAPTCRWCAQNLANINALATSVGRTYRFVALSNSDREFRAYAASGAMSFPLFVFNAQRLQAATEVQLEQAFGATPQTLVIGRDGVVERAWMGAFAESTQQDVERFFGVSLPGLVTPQASGATAGQ